MKVFIVYDSSYGNTTSIAQALAEAVRPPHSVIVTNIDKAKTTDLLSADLIIAGSPTQGGRPTKRLHSFIDDLPANSLTGKYITAFDTRFAITKHGLALRLLMRTIGFAAPHLFFGLKAKGGIPAHQPEGFIVDDNEGPLQQGELERAAEWMKNILRTVAAATPVNT